MKAIAVIVGMVLTIALYFGLILCWSHFSPSKHTQSYDVPENLLLFIVGIIFYPAAMLFLASIVTGIILEPQMDDRSYLALIFYAPG